MELDGFNIAWLPRRHWLGPVKPVVAQQGSIVSIVDEATAKSAFRMDMVVASSPLWTRPGWCWSQQHPWRSYVVQAPAVCGIRSTGEEVEA